MLGLDDQRTAALVGISRNTPRDWRGGNRPKTATTRRLYELAAVLDLVATREPAMAEWARRPSPDGRPWLELAAGPDGPSAVLGHHRGALLVPRRPGRLDVASDEEGEAPDASATAGPASALVARRPGSRRRAR